MIKAGSLESDCVDGPADIAKNPDEALPCAEESVVFGSAPADVTLAGALTLPDGSARCPAVVLVSGSGPLDRDGSWGHMQPLRVLAHALTRRGIVVLRYDNRGVGDSTGCLLETTLSDRTDDVQAGMALLAGHPRVDPNRIGLVGHSEGAAVGALAAVRPVGRQDSPPGATPASSAGVQAPPTLTTPGTRTDAPPVCPAFLVMLAGPGMPMADVFCTQDVRLMRQAGATEEFLSRYLPVSRAILQVVQGESNDDAAIDRICELGKTLPPLEEQEQAWSAVLLHPYEPEGGMLMSPWFKHLLAYDPEATLPQVTCPVLALQGDKDFQLDPVPNLQAIRQALAGNPHVTCRELPDLNHMFQQAVTGLPTEYLDLPESIAATVPPLIAEWILGSA